MAQILTHRQRHPSRQADPDPWPIQQRDLQFIVPCESSTGGINRSLINRVRRVEGRDPIDWSAMDDPPPDEIERERDQIDLSIERMQGDTGHPTLLDRDRASTWALLAYLVRVLWWRIWRRR